MTSANDCQDFMIQTTKRKHFVHNFRMKASNDIIVIMNENRYKTGCYILLNHFILSYADYVFDEFGKIFGKL